MRIPNQANARILRLILVAALLARVYWVFTHPHVIDNEGANYARRADNLLTGNGFVNIYGDVSLGEAPFYSLLIAVVSSIVRNSELSGLIVSIIVGTCLVLPLYFIALHTYGERAALGAAILVALHPFMVLLSASVLSEATFLFFLLAGVYFALREIELQTGKYAAFAGACFALAYVTRSEAILFIGVAFWALCISAFKRRRTSAHSGLRLAKFLVPAIVIAAPYVLFLTLNSGHVRLEGVSADNLAVGQRINAGQSYLQAQNGLAHSTAISISGAGLVRYALSAAKRHIRTLYQLLPSALFGSPLLLLLVVLGLFRRPWSPRRIGAELFFLLMLLTAFVPLLSIQWFWDRYAAPFVPFLIIWAGNGCAELYAWLSDSARSMQRRPPSLRAFGAALILAFGAIFMVTSFRLIAQAEPRAQTEKNVGLWLAQHGAAHKKLMDTETIAAYYAGANLIEMPYGDSSAALGYIHKEKPDFVVLLGSRANDYPFLRQWLEHGLPDRKARLVRAFGRSIESKALVYRYCWGCPGQAGAIATSLRRLPAI
jgi:4-amino-4-deoxy-L-arabinose transferase-like glycosyltransferase